MRARLALLGERGREPVEALVEAVARRGAARLDVPLAVAQAVQAELVRHLGRGHGVGQILLVREHQEDGLPQLVLVEHAVQLVARVVDAVAVVRVDDEDEALRILVVVAPERADLVLPPDVPHRERDVFVLDRLDVEADRGNRGHDLAELELVEDRGLAGRVEADHEDAHLLLAEHALPDLAHGETHGALSTRLYAVWGEVNYRGINRRPG
mmetsp:Transcript_19579/g.58225  ORF Transcript_19579/g.58225 Transcript_19579/m.58225 type:complete len:211 (+) Transcript_19579:79-711(+)